MALTQPTTTTSPRARVMRPRSRSLLKSAATLLLAPALAGCVQTTAMLDNLITGPRTMDRTAIAQEMYNDCTHDTTPIFSRPAGQLLGKCKCASVSFLNYATDEQVDEMRNAWVNYGDTPAFEQKVMATTESFHATHCGVRASSADLLRLTSLNGSSKPSGDGAAGDRPMVEVVTEPNTLKPVSLMNSNDSVQTFALAPSAFSDRNLVKYIQRKLKGLGYAPGPIDGIVGARTKSALKAYQTAQGMPDDTALEDVMAALIF